MFLSLRGFQIFLKWLFHSDPWTELWNKDRVYKARENIILHHSSASHFTIILQALALFPHSSLLCTSDCSEHPLSSGCFSALFCIICEEKRSEVWWQGTHTAVLSIQALQGKTHSCRKAFKHYQLTHANTVVYIVQVFPVQIWWITLSSSFQMDFLFLWVTSIAPRTKLQLRMNGVIKKDKQES